MLHPFFLPNMDENNPPSPSKVNVPTQNQPVRVSLEELRSFAAVLTDGSLLKQATMRVIAEQEANRRKREAKAIELLKRTD